MWAAKLAGVKIRLHTIAGLPWVESKGMMRRLLITVEKLTAYAATSIFPNSFVQRDFLIANRIAKRKIKVIGNGSSNGIDIKYFSLNDDIKKQAEMIRQQQRIDENGWVWIFVGRVVKDKGIAELIDAFLKIHQDFPNDRLLLLGDQEPHLDPLDEKCVHLIKSHTAIISCGFQKDIRPYLAASQVLVFPSYREGFPNVPMQAGAMGCALILSDINGCNEIVSQGNDGWLVPIKNTSALTATMLAARSNPTQTTLFAEAIKIKIASWYAQSNLWNCILQEYQQLLKTNKS